MNAHLPVSRSITAIVRHAILLAGLTSAAGCLQVLGDDFRIEERAATAGPIAILGDPCVAEGDLACAGKAQKRQLQCDASRRWVPGGVCAGATNCDTRSDTGTLGSCQPIAAECIDKAPRTFVCNNKKTAIIECDDDLLSAKTSLTCATGAECKDAACVCKPGFTGDGVICVKDGV